MKKMSPLSKFVFKAKSFKFYFLKSVSFLLLVFIVVLVNTRFIPAQTITARDVFFDPPGKSGSGGARPKKPTIKPLSKVTRNKPVKNTQFSPTKVTSTKKPTQIVKNKTYKPNTRLQGIEMGMELIKNGISLFVSPETIFTTGDDFRFHLRINFDGYLAVINKQSSGGYKLLYPCDKTEINKVTAMDFITIPKGDRPFEFQGTSGEENIYFIISQKPILLVNEMLDSNSSVCLPGKAMSKENLTIRDLETEIDSTERDIGLVEDTDIDKETKATYFLVPENKLKNATGFRLKLIHVPPSN
jgi:hypothetical protein